MNRVASLELLLAVSAIAVGIVACGAPPPPPAPAIVVAPTESEPMREREPAARPPEPAKAPQGYVEAEIGGVMDHPDLEGFAVILLDRERSIALPIFIGGTEALAIELRHQKRRYPRPLTHDLLDELMRQLGAALYKVHIDAIRDNTFIGTVFVKSNGRVIELDARASDAIALAIGSGAPIFVHRSVFDQAGIARPDPPPGGA